MPFGILSRFQTSDNFLQKFKTISFAIFIFQTHLIYRLIFVTTFCKYRIVRVNWIENCCGEHFQTHRKWRSLILRQVHNKIPFVVFIGFLHRLRFFLRRRRRRRRPLLLLFFSFYQNSFTHLQHAKIVGMVNEWRFWPFPIL